MPNVKAIMKATRPRTAPAKAEVGDSFSSSDRRCAIRPNRYPTSMEAITTTVATAKTAQIGMESTLI
jgi:hypothetical protein